MVEARRNLILQNHTGIVVDCVTNSNIESECLYMPLILYKTRLVLYRAANLNLIHGPSDLPYKNACGSIIMFEIFDS